MRVFSNRTKPPTNAFSLFRVIYYYYTFDLIYYYYYSRRRVNIAVGQVGPYSVAAEFTQFVMHTFSARNNNNNDNNICVPQRIISRVPPIYYVRVRVRV